MARQKSQEKSKWSQRCVFMPALGFAAFMLGRIGPGAVQDPIAG